MGAADMNLREHFLGFLPMKETTDTFMTENILHQLEEISLSLENLHGQGYDNGSSMKGSTRCWDVLLHHVASLKEKPLCETRCESCIEALKPLRYHIGDICEAIMEIADGTTLTGLSGNSARTKVKALANGSSDFKFLVSLTLSSVFGFLYDIKNMYGKTQIEMREHCVKLESALQHGESKDIDAADLCSEIQAIAHHLPESLPPQAVLKFICEHSLIVSVSNIFTALCILLTLSVTGTY
ncbi:uncharacterized protein LOC111088397, partial [Limulus polyphemus]|uniref:Uncharacterized protein LOC111088397 n=1 Tax=Limulus polyphemus TaxID=6850 RepID=A0ABM1TE14_LIMPO